MYLLDTNHCTFLIEGEPKVVNHFRELGKVTLATSAIVAGELRFMAQNSQQKTANLIKIHAFLNRIDIYPIDDETAEIYGDFKSEIIKRFAAKEKSKRKTTQLQEIGVISLHTSLTQNTLNSVNRQHTNRFFRFWE
ncbi:MAG: type II toxin-antitoxin system VapC family toxin [Nostoc sp.]|uniref:type II toxin-antitoxin system VapC family toxin n=1 Tax=Nostoc sp. TaxID=1180 RepID=UPI002FF742F2